MMISTKGRYALRVMLDLAAQPEGEYISLKTICERQDVSMKYLEAIVSTLNKAGLLDSLRGKSGGYRLARKPEEYNLYTILNLADGSLAPVSCLEDGCGDCIREGHCPTRPLWDELYTVIKEFLESKTLADLMKSDNIGADTK